MGLVQLGQAFGPLLLIRLAEQLRGRDTETVGELVEPVEIDVLLASEHCEEFSSIDPCSIGDHRQWGVTRRRQPAQVVREKLCGAFPRHGHL
ncbi:hypothetical protein PPSIR1_19032 [Plesiocystis pacifica SIR-1]|uniref:Uncharacterized protein n=1 Tax=Plesiocystis pacifica SIR-1 TaxID=391625 RepID=A6GGM3_9BACT|nr:hypothetical protein PPSIR1_19032 [Plesiocystis pacifica SIR-1]